MKVSLKSTLMMVPSFVAVRPVVKWVGLYMAKGSSMFRVKVHMLKFSLLLVSHWKLFCLNCLQSFQKRILFHEKTITSWRCFWRIGSRSHSWIYFLSIYKKKISKLKINCKTNWKIFRNLASINILRKWKSIEYWKTTTI